MRSVVPAVLREEPAFRLLFTGQLLSVLGDRVTMLVLPFAVLSVGGGPAGVVLVSVAQFVPFVVLALPAGVLADRLDRRRIMVASDAVRFVVQLVAGALLLTGHAGVPVLVVLAVVFGAADAFFQPAITGLVPATVSPAGLQPANALRGLTFSIGSIAGPAIGGVLIALVGPGGSFLFDALTFAVSAVTLLLLRLPRAAQDAPAAERQHFFADLAAGAASVRSRPWVVAFLAAGSAYTVLVLPAIFVLGPVLSGERFGGATGWAVITAAFGVGSLAGDLLLLRWRPRFALRASALALIGASCQGLIIGSGLGTLPVAALEVLAGVCVTVYFSLWETSLQEHVPDAELSRVASYDYLTSTGAIPLGSVAAGALSALAGPGAAILVLGAAGLLVAFAVVAVPAVRRLPRGSGAVEAAIRPEPPAPAV
ncbi:MFS transporter [Amnibacterium setariae]|uniref:MFS transporter n=1 Tax=Amnibacterium setariae TaxID=2306585 RepID=UPI001314AF54|nr:MFS transporter [Amnibacterium setariae]